jgi:hypothetical protein
MLREPQTQIAPAGGSRTRAACVIAFAQVEGRMFKRCVHKIEPIGLIWL